VIHGVRAFLPRMLTGGDEGHFVNPASMAGLDYPPSKVAEQVVAGIREGRFYIVPAQPEVKGNIAIRAQNLVELRNPTLRRG